MPAWRRAPLSNPAAIASRPLVQRCSWRHPAPRRRSRPGTPLRSPRRSPPWRDRRSQRRPAHRRCAPGAASALADRPTRDTSRRTRNSQTRPGLPFRHGIRSQSSDSVIFGRRNSRCTTAQSGIGRCSAATAGGGGYRRASSWMSSSPSGNGQPSPAREHALCSHAPLPGSAAGFSPPPAVAAPDPTAAAAPRVSSASTISRLASRSPAPRQRIETTHG